MAGVSYAGVLLVDAALVPRRRLDEVADAVLDEEGRPVAEAPADGLARSLEEELGAGGLVAGDPAAAEELARPHAPPRGLARWAAERTHRGFFDRALGGTLFQDVGTDPGTELQHGQSEPRDQPTHKVTVKAKSRLAEVLGTDELEVNSMHHQAVRHLGTGLEAVAWSPDLVIEGIEMSDASRFVLGVQWHPEELCAHSEPARRLFAALVGAAARS